MNVSLHVDSVLFQHVHQQCICSKTQVQKNKRCKSMTFPPPPKKIVYIYKIKYRHVVVLKAAGKVTLKTVLGREGGPSNTFKNSRLSYLRSLNSPLWVNPPPPLHSHTHQPTFNTCISPETVNVINSNHFCMQF